MPVIRRAAGLSRYFDGLSKFRDHWLNAGSVRISSRITVVSVVISVVQTLADPNLSVADRIANFLGVFIVTIAIAFLYYYTSHGDIGLCSLGYTFPQY